MRTFKVSLNRIKKHPRLRIDPDYWESQVIDLPYECKLSAVFDKDETIYNSLCFTLTGTSINRIKEMACRQLLDFCKQNHIKGYIDVSIEIKRGTYRYEKTRQTFWPAEDYSLWFERQ